MKHYLWFVLALAFAGIFLKRVSWKGWTVIGGLIFGYVMYCWKQG